MPGKRRGRRRSHIYLANSILILFLVIKSLFIWYFAYLYYIIVFCVPIICRNNFQHSYRCRHFPLLLLIILIIWCMVSVCVCVYFMYVFYVFLCFATIFASSDFRHEHFYLHALCDTLLFFHLWFGVVPPLVLCCPFFLYAHKQIYSAHLLNTSTHKQSIITLFCCNLIRRQGFIAH